MKRLLTHLLLLVLCVSLIGCSGGEGGGSSGSQGGENSTSNYAITIGTRTYTLFPNYLVDEEVYLASNLTVKEGLEVRVLKDSKKIDVELCVGANNLTVENGALKIHNKAKVQVHLTVVDGKHYLSISGYTSDYSTQETTVKDGYVSGYALTSEVSYSGDLVNGQPHGKGIYVWTLTNCIYFGEFENGKYSGEGEFVWHNGDHLKGEFYNHAPVKGEYVYVSSGCVYVGSLSNWQFHGDNGVFTWPSGWRFEGSFANGKATYGKTYTNRRTGVIWYEGHMHALNDINANYPGTAHYVFSNGCTYTGGYKSSGALNDGKYHGEGVFSWPSGWKFEGTFANGKATNGKTTTPNTIGLVWYEGAMNDLNNIKENVLGYGYYVLEDGTIYEGQMYASGALQSCVFSGEGKLTYTDGTIVSGTFENGELIGG